MDSVGISRKALLAGAIALLALASGGAYWLARISSPPPPVLWGLPEFSLINERGEAIGRKNLLGRIWVANTIFTRCEDTCPLQTETLMRFQKEFPGEPRFLAVTIDPKNDTPGALTRYAKKHGTDPERWVFLTGGEKELAGLVRRGFRLPTHLTSGRVGVFSAWVAGLLSPAPAWAHHPGRSSGAAGGGEAIIHSSRFLLIDRRARVRGYYHSDNEESLRKLRKDLRVLLSE